MKLKRISAFILLAFTSILLFSCNNSKEEASTTIDPTYGGRIEEDLTTLNIIDDNYRNYYEIFVASFYDSNGDGCGDLNGVSQKLDYIKDLGFNGIWLMPVNPSGSYHKYDVDNYYEIDKKYGTMEDFENLIKECHKRGIKLIIDLVLNHSSSVNPLFKRAKEAYEKKLNNEALTAEDEKYQDFYNFYSSSNEVPGTIKAHKLTSKNGKTYYYEGNFSSNMPEFNYDNPYVYEEVNNIIDFYLDKGLDGFRLDAVKYFYYDSHIKSIEVLSKINKMVKDKNPNAYIVGECWDTDTTIKNYYTSGIDSFFNFTTSVTNSSSSILSATDMDGKLLDRYYNGMLQNLELADGNIPAPFLDNHDMRRFTSPAIQSINRVKFQYALLQMMNGATFTYYGSEIGMVGTNPPDENVRIAFYWDKFGSEGICNSPYGATEENYPYPHASKQMKDEHSLLNFYKKVLLIRNQNPEIARGAFSKVLLDKDNALLFITKNYNNNDIGLIFNFSATRDINISFKDYGYNEVVGQLVSDSENRYIGLKADGSIILPPYSIVVVR